MSGQKRNEELAKANRLGQRLELVIIIILTICYISQGAKNSIPVWGLIVIMLSLWVPVIAVYVIYKKNPASGLIKHVIGIGYGIFYVTVCLISDQQLAFTYAFPMLIVVGIYCDFRFSITVGCACTAIAIVHAVLFTTRAGFTPQAIAAMEIEIASSVLVGIYAAISNKFIIDMNNRNLKVINESSENSEKMLSEVMDISEKFVKDVQAVSDKMEELAASSEETRDAMLEVSQGTADTAESVQNQLIKTEEIQNQIERVTSASDSIGGNIEEAIHAIKEGKENIDRLMQQVKISEEAGTETITEVEDLKKNTEEMEGIIAMIQGITSQTSMLSLNASIEAARAGEAGRGFAVVAEQISALASQTKTATETINAMIGTVTSKMDEVARTINSLVDSNRIQNESASVTAGSFERIAENTENINVHSEELSKIVDSLGKANREIVDSIQTVSAISEQVSAHANNTAKKSDQTENVVLEVQDVVNEMTVNAERLKAL